MKLGDMVKVLFLGDVEPDIAKLWAGRTCEIVAVNENSFFIMNAELGRYEVFADEIELVNTNKWNVEASSLYTEGYIIVCAQFYSLDEARRYAREMNLKDDRFSYYVVAVK